MPRNRGRIKPSLRSLSREKPTRQELLHQLDTMVWAPPIILAVLTAAIIDQELEDLLRRKLKVADDTFFEELADNDGPLGTLSRKIDLGFALGLYDLGLRQNLHIVRKIRNVFAHARKLLDFDHELIGKEMRLVSLPKGRTTPQHRQMKKIKLGQLTGKAAYEVIWVTVFSALIGRITRSHRASARNYARKAKGISKELHPLAWALLNLPPSATPAGSPPPFPLRQIDDPKS